MTNTITPAKGINKMIQALKNLDHLYVFMMLYIDGIEQGLKFTFDEYLIERKKYTGKAGK